MLKVLDRMRRLDTQRNGCSLDWLGSIRVQRRDLGRAIAVMMVTVGLLALSKYMFRAHLRTDGIMLFAAMVWALAFVIDHLQTLRPRASDSLNESEKLQSQKMEAVGRLAGGVAHDFNNLLAVITGYSDLLLENLSPSDPSWSKIEQIKQAANSAASLTRQLLMFSRQQIIQPQILDINQTLGNIEKMLRRLIRENIEFTVVLDPDLNRINADPAQIEQVIVNLVVNARDALPNGGKLHVRTSNVRLEKNSVHAAAGSPAGRFVLLEVTDTGTGMDLQTQAHMFEPFFTTKAVGKGTGLGLATVYGIVKQSNGHIEVRSALGHGSCFMIYLPAVEQAKANPQSLEATAKPAFAGETVLVVEDARALREMICHALSGFGCTVLSARDGQEALRMLKGRGYLIDLLLTDVVMPGMNGADLAKEVRVLCPETKILYMTGYSGEFIRADMLSPGVSLIRKPFTPADLARKASKMLADKPHEVSQEVAHSHASARGAKAASA